VQPIWVIQSSGQVTVEGNEVLSDETVRSLLPITYPQSILKIQPQAIANHLEAQAPIAEATVIRRLLPPGLVVQIQERHPVAVLIRQEASSSPNTPPLRGGSVDQPAYGTSTQVGLIDEKGFWMPLDDYIALNENLEIPSLKVVGMREQDRLEWSQLYHDLLQSPVQVFEIDWRNPTNLVLDTELGTVYLGAYSSQFLAQLRVLDQMRNLPNVLQSNDIEYIDLTHPEEPFIQTRQRIQPDPLPSP
jgi:cell division protein FtsQ